MSKITLGVIAERIEQHHAQQMEVQKENKLDHQIMKDGIAHTNGDVGELKLFKAQAKGAITILAIIMTGIVIPLVFKYLSISLFG